MPQTRLTSAALYFLHIYVIGYFHTASSFTIGARSSSSLLFVEHQPTHRSSTPPSSSSSLRHFEHALSSSRITHDATISSWNRKAIRKTATCLLAKKQSRSTLLNPVKDDDKGGTAGVKEEVEEVYGTKFFGGSAVKEELFDEALEEQADKLIALYSTNSKATKVGEDSSSQMYSRFSDTDAFDPACRNFAQVLQAAINQALYLPLDETQETVTANLPNQIYSPTVEWKTPFSRAKDSKNPLDELTNSLNFFKRVDVAIISAKSIGKTNVNDGNNLSDGKVENIQIRWEISLLWPNIWESRVLLSGTSNVMVDTERMMILSQNDCLDCGGKDGQDVIQAIASQIQPRFWDLYHIGMTPSAEMMPRMNPGGSAAKKGAFSNYNVFEIPPRLVLQPTIVDEGGRDARQAEAVPNHAFTCAIKTTGSKAQRYTTTSPVEVSIRRSLDDESSLISWNIPLTPEFLSYYDELPLGDVMDGETTKYCYQPKRLVATLPFGGYAQDKDVSDVRKTLYEQVTRDGLKPKMSNGKPQFFFLNNDTKACFTADGGLGMAVYDWRPKFAKCNEVGIELELE
jgi:hypothetical protein